MAGFFGFFDYSKPGKGISKDEPVKPRFLLFWELFFRKFWKLIQLNLLYIAFCIPVVTIGPATAGFTYVLRNLANETPVFMFSDFWDAFKSNLKQSLLYSVIVVIFTILMSISWQFYSANMQNATWMYVPFAMCIFLSVLFILMSFYVFLMIVTLDLPFKSILKNAAILAVVCMKTNFLTLLFTGLIVGATVLFFPISIFLVLLIIPAWIGFIICFNSYPGIKKYAIDPFLAAQAAQKLQDEQDETVFRDDKTIADQ